MALMVFGEVALMAAALFAGQASAQAAAVAPAPGVSELSKDQAEARMSKCGARRFETSADVPMGGKVRRARITLCAADSDTTAEWASKLEKAAGQIEAQPTLPAEAKAQLLGDLRAEIARVKGGPAPSLMGLPGTNAPFQRLEPINALPPLPAPTSPLADIHALPPLPSAPIAALATPIAGASLVGGPQLTVQCALVGVDRARRCGVIASDERLVIRASEAFNGPVSLRFRRSGSTVSAEVPFASQGLRPGQTARFAVPKAICAGRIRADFDIEVVTPAAKAGRVGNILGPFEVRCGL